MMSRFLVGLAIALSLATGAVQAGQNQSSADAATQAEVPAAAPVSSGVKVARLELPVTEIVAAAPPAARPAPPAYAPVAPGPGPGPSAGNLMQTIFALLLVLGLLAALAWFLKRYGPKTAVGSANLRIVGALNLGGRERIMVVEVGDQWIVVGASPGRVNALATLPRQEGAEASATLHPHQSSAGNFSEWLKQTIDKRNAK